MEIDDSKIMDIGSSDWLVKFWESLSERTREALTLRSQGKTLQEIGDSYELTRQRIQQLLKENEDQLMTALRKADPELETRLKQSISGQLVVSDVVVSGLLPVAPIAAQLTVARLLELSHPKTWDGELFHWWTSDASELDQRLRRLADLLPLTDIEMETALRELALDSMPLVGGLVDSPNSKIKRHGLGWIRPNRAARDTAFLWLQAQGSPRSATDIAAVAGVSQHAMRETMRRDDSFALIRPESFWALADWRLPGAESGYLNADDVVVEVVRESGPMDFVTLKTEVQKRYRVTDWRIRQCVSGSKIGLTPEGKYDLVERGAQPIEDLEPRRPDNIQASGASVGIRLPVTHDLLRGSGLSVNLWLTWILGLRTASTMRRFDMDQPPGEVRIRRATSSASISTLRAAVREMDLIEGCQIALLLNIDADTARVVHACTEAECPAFSKG